MWASVCGAIVGLSLMLMSANREAAPAAAPTVFLTRQERQVGDVVAVMTVANVFALLLLVTDRYWTSVSIGAALIALLWAGNRLKVAILNEVLVFSDIFLAGHALRYPRLYFGYAPKWVWPVVIAGGAALGWCLTIEAPMNVLTDGERLGFVGLWLGGGGLMVVRMAKPSGRIKSFLSHYPMSFDTQTDAWAYTPLGAALLHVLRHGQYRHALRERFAKIKGESVRSFDGKHTPALGHRLLIQAESFVPIGALLDRPSRMPAIDELMCRSTSGALKLDWRGAYTMRTEFAVLTGIAPRELETYGFDPYRLAAMMPMQSLAWQLKAQGYRTVVCHPNDARFFERDKVMKHLGFDEFIDLSVLQTKWPKMMEKSALCGRYVSDASLLQWAAEYLRAAKTPTFLFIITMEAHGPWDGRKFEGAQALSEVERYEVHLSHLNDGVVKIGKAWGKNDALSILMYGDHLPGLEALRARTQDIPADTVWLMWDGRSYIEMAPAKSGRLRTASPLKPEDLGKKWLSREPFI